MADVCMFLLTPSTHDARVEKEATSLVGAGHRVRVIAAAGAGQPLRESRDGYEILRVESEPPPARAIRSAMALRHGGRAGAAPGTVVRLDGGPPGRGGARIPETAKGHALRLAPTPRP